MILTSLDSRHDTGWKTGDVVLETGDKVYVITRQLFSEDVRRHFAGVVVACSGDLVRVQGYAFVLLSMTNQYERRSEKRVRVFSLSDAGNIVNVLPRSIELDKLAYEFSSGKLLVTDGSGYKLELSEFGAGS